MEELKELAAKCEDSSFTLVDELNGTRVIRKSLARLMERMDDMEHGLEELNPHPMVTLALARIRDDIHLIQMASEQNTLNVLSLAECLAQDASKLSMDIKLHNS